MISPAEYEARLERARAMMRSQELDAIVVTAEANLRYFTGHAPHMYVSPTRPWFAVLPLAAEPVALIPGMGRADMARDCWFSRIETWPSPRPRDEGVTALARLLLDSPRRFGRIGFELGPETRLGMPAADFLRLLELMKPALTAVDCSSILRTLRAIKSDAEVKLIRTAIDAAQAAFDDVPKLARTGMTEHELYRAFQVRLLTAGAERVPYVAIGSGFGGYDSIVRGPTSRKLGRGDILGIDTGATVSGYWADFNRNYALGEPQAAAVAAYRTLWRAQDAALAALRPGMTANQLWRVMAEQVGLDGTAVGRMGHGIGLDYTEPPSNHPDDATVLEAGMVLTLEPSLVYRAEDETGPVERFMALEEDLLLTADGPCLLTRRAPPELVVIADA
jgi:Xaa-Pro dipeptidase